MGVLPATRTFVVPLGACGAEKLFQGVIVVSGMVMSFVSPERRFRSSPLLGAHFVVSTASTMRGSGDPEHEMFMHVVNWCHYRILPCAPMQ